jgi:hypothetical protein
LGEVDHPRDGQNPLRLFHFIAPRVLIPSLPPFVVMGKGDTLNCSIGFLAALALRQACLNAGLALVPDRIK